MTELTIEDKLHMMLGKRIEELVGEDINPFLAENWKLIMEDPYCKRLHRILGRIYDEDD